MEPTEQKTGKGGIIAGVVAAVLIVCAGAYAFFTKNSGSSEE